jgi:hypothetical protein
MRYDRPKGQRMKRYFCGITNFSGMWWLNESKYWEYEVNDIPEKESYGTHAPCRTLRAFRRHLRQHPEIKGKAVLCSRFIGHDVYA